MWKLQPVKQMRGRYILKGSHAPGCLRRPALLSLYFSLFLCFLFELHQLQSQLRGRKRERRGNRRAQEEDGRDTAGGGTPTAKPPSVKNLTGDELVHTEQAPPHSHTVLQSPITHKVKEERNTFLCL